MSDPIDELAAALNELDIAETSETEPVVPAGQRPCPICEQSMRVESHGPVDVDICPRHGIWLDNGELPAILSYARSRHAESVRRRIARAKRDGKISGTLLGAWSLLFE